MTAVLKQLKRHVHELEKEGPPGRRFQNRYRREHKSGKRRPALGRVVRALLALVSTVIGVILVFIPGPAVLFFFIAAALLASDSLAISRALDWTEVKGRALYAWAHRRWKKLPLSAKIAVVCLVILGSIGATYLSIRFLQR